MRNLTAPTQRWEQSYSSSTSQNRRRASKCLTLTSSGRAPESRVPPLNSNVEPLSGMSLFGQEIMRVPRLFIALLPLLLTASFAWLLSGRFSLSGGEKDIFLALPLLLWSLLFLCSYLALWWRKATNGRAVSVSAAVATGLTVLLSIALFFGFSWLRP